MHPKSAGLLFVSLLCVNLAGWLAGFFVNFLALEPALWAGAVYGIVCAPLYALYARHQRRNLHRYSEDMRVKVVDSFGTKPWTMHVVITLVMSASAAMGFSTTGAAIYTRLAGKQEARTFTVAKSEWIGSKGRRGGGNCYEVTLVEFPELGQSIAAPCYNKKVLAETRLSFIGYHSSLGSWYSAIHVE